MDFDDPEQMEEDVGLPTGSSYEMPTHNSPRGGASVGGSGEAVGPVSGNTKARQGRYKECLRNHAVGIGSHAVDGCGEFLAAGEEGTIDALRCAACGCHRNFHRKEAEGGTRARGALEAATGFHQQLSPFCRTAAQYLQHHQHPPLPPHHTQIPLAFSVAAQHQRPPPPPPRLALPLTSSARGGRGGQSREEQEGASDPMMGLGGGGGNGIRASLSGSGSHKKRFRTKFTAEQKDKMLAFAERVGWRIQKQDEAAVQQLCEEACIRRHVLKVWMHNNKHTLGKRSPS